jgi:hypothetical protein
MEPCCTTPALSSIAENVAFSEERFWIPCSKEWWLAPFTESARSMLGLVGVVAFAALGTIASIGMTPVFTEDFRKHAYRVYQGSWSLVAVLAKQFFTGFVGALPFIGAWVAVNYERTKRLCEETGCSQRPACAVHPAVFKTFVEEGTGTSCVTTNDAQVQTDPELPAVAIPPTLPLNFKEFVDEEVQVGTSMVLDAQQQTDSVTSPVIVIPVKPSVHEVQTKEGLPSADDFECDTQSPSPSVGTPGGSPANSDCMHPPEAPSPVFDAVESADDKEARLLAQQFADSKALNRSYLSEIQALNQQLARLTTLRRPGCHKKRGEKEYTDQEMIQVLLSQNEALIRGMQQKVV